MAIAAADVAALKAALEELAADGGLVAALRRRFPALAFVRCDAADVTEAPFAVFPKVDLHLLDNSDHCVQIVSQIESATGFVIAFK